MRDWRRGAVAIVVLLAACERYDAPGHGKAEVLATCCEDLGRCVPDSLVPEKDRDRLPQDRCAESLRCTPTVVLTGAIACRALDGAEGRCLPECVPEVAEYGDFVGQTSCPDKMRCLPCYDPRSAEATGACSLSPGDAPVEPPMPYPECCNGAARCVPRSQLGGLDSSLIGTLGCEAVGALCLPSEWVEDPSFVPPTCESTAELEGRCISTCFPQVAAEAEALPVGRCGSGERCAPCFDPWSGDSTGVCETPNDPGAVDPPFVFPRCCIESGTPKGTCLPIDLIPIEVGSILPALDCPAGNLCAPDRTVRPPSPPGLGACGYTLGDFVTIAGVCMPTCFIPADLVAAGQPSCVDADLCVPCDLLPLPRPPVCPPVQ